MLCAEAGALLRRSLCFAEIDKWAETQYNADLTTVGRQQQLINIASLIQVKLPPAVNVADAEGGSGMVVD